MIELLAPAGDLNRLKMAFLYGADACYIGGKSFSLRANASNFTIEEINEATSFAHKLNKKVYVTINMVFHNEDLDDLLDYLRELEKAKIDGVIVSDPVVFDMIFENNINIDVHISTQASTCNKETVKYFLDKGATRVVLAREVPRYDIKDIIDETGAEIEVFLHGAMCTCVSGRCVLSNYFTNRDSNRGGCAQVCRFSFDLNGKKRDPKYSIATCDLNLGEYIPDLIDIGVKSLKIEGRMRSVYYVATIISCYRKLIDAYYNNNFSQELLNETTLILDRVSNRPSTSHFYKGSADASDQYYIGREEVSNQDFLGLILDYDDENKMLVVEQRNYFAPGDKVVFFTPSGEEYSYTIDKIYDENGDSLDVARHPRQIIKMPFSQRLEEFSMMRVDFVNK